MNKKIQKDISNENNINIKFKYLAIASYIYIILPIIIFFVTWLKFYVGIPISILLISSLLYIIKNDYLDNEAKVCISKKHFIGVGIVIFLWIWLSGQGGFFFQTWDNHSRNAIFRDLIDFNWPVIYPETGNALVYYIMHWIVPALVGKTFGWTVGNLALLIWTYCGLILTYLLILYITKGTKKSHLWITCIIFITWSGLNIVGAMITDALGKTQFVLGSFEGWLDFSRNGFDYSYLYRNNLDFLSQVYNQTVVPWMIIPLILENKRIRNFAFLGLIILPYAPIPFIGFIPIFLILAMSEYYRLIKNKKYITAIKETFSIPNIVSIITVFFVFLLYFKCNVGINNTSIFFVPLKAFDIYRVAMLCLFYLIEFGIICMLIFPMYKKDKLFWIVIISLIVIPIFRIGSGRDFCMNASLAPLFILMIMIINFINNEESLKLNIRKILIVIVLTIAAVSSFGDVMSRINIMKDKHQFPMVADDTKTLSHMRLGDDNLNTFEENYLVPNPEETLFFKYLAKKKN